jgi:ferredoxin--NADP+ reductase
MGFLWRCYLSEGQLNRYLAAVIGAGPAGLYASQYLARQNVEVVLFNRDIKPGGLAEYGIFPAKQKMRSGLLSHFHRILNMPNVHYIGNVLVGQSGDITLDQLRKAGFQAIMITTGAQKNNWLGLPGEDLEGVYQANDIVFHYNQLPTHTDMNFRIGQNVAVIGVGNVMLDIMNYLKHEGIERTVTAYARRGPVEVKFDRETLEPVAECLDLDFIRREAKKVQPQIEAMGKDVRGFYDLIEEACIKAEDCMSGLRVRLAFLRSPRRMIGDGNGRVQAIVFEKNRLIKDGNTVVSSGTGEFETIPVDTVIFSIGSQVDTGFGLPVSHGNYVTSPQPRFPVDDISYEVYNPELCSNCEDIFVSGWARQGGEGIVGLARKDAERGAKAMLAYLTSLEPASENTFEAVFKALTLDQGTTIRLEELKILEREEQRIAEEMGLPAFKFDSNEEMLRVIKGN